SWRSGATSLELRVAGKRISRCRSCASETITMRMNPFEIGNLFIVCFLVMSIATSIRVERTMMGEMEKNAQIGELVKQRQSQRVTLEHLRLKGKKIAAAYSAFGYA